MTAWTPPSSTLTLDDQAWNEHAEHIPRILAGIRWWMGDLILTAPDHDSFVRVLNTIRGLESGDTSDMHTVAERFPPARRVPGVSWLHHLAVHELPAGTADPILAAAAEQNLSLQDVRQAAAAARPRKKPARGGLNIGDDR